MAVEHIFYKSKTWNAKEMQTYAEDIFQMLTFIFICSLLRAPPHDDSAFIKYAKWPYKSQKRDSSFILYGHSLSRY